MGGQIEGGIVLVLCIVVAVVHTQVTDDTTTHLTESTTPLPTLVPKDISWRSTDKIIVSVVALIAVCVIGGAAIYGYFTRKQMRQTRQNAYQKQFQYPEEKVYPVGGLDNQGYITDQQMALNAGLKAPPLFTDAPPTVSMVERGDQDVTPGHYDNIQSADTQRVTMDDISEPRPSTSTGSFTSSNSNQSAQMEEKF